MVEGMYESSTTLCTILGGGSRYITRNTSRVHPGIDNLKCNLRVIGDLVRIISNQD